jgi:outer membrane protein assembly factor BamD
MPKGSQLSPLRRCFAVLAAALIVASCGLLPEVKDETASWSAEKLYDEAHGAMVTGNYTRAIKLFDTLEGRFPYGRHAQQAILEGAYSNYRQGETAIAIAACDRFIRTYPNSPLVEYAYYLKGLVNFREDQGLFGYVVEQDLSERDPKMTRESFAAFKELVTRFPESRYAADSVERMRYLTNALGMYEVHVAQYYYNRGAYVAAVNRAATTVTNYPQTPANEQALVLMIQGYDKLGMLKLRDDARRVLKQNFPNSAYFRGGSDKPWWKFWQSDEVVELLRDDTVPKSQANPGPAPPSDGQPR